MHEPHHEKEHVKMSDTAKFLRCWPNTRGMADIWKLKFYPHMKVLLAGAT